ncbi:hypothetical protein [Mycobacteroides chelonae]|uniref:hypothetical protein n=1 Tax=Mycobacteroides chelonae TaxID=1774 RepID=UPI0013F4E753|nr:hypothetical protein [Mycobacteroides chelonae]
MITLIAAAALALGVPLPAAPAALPVCQFEDGNPDGEPCMWTDLDTGRAFYVGSENYR